MTQPNALVQTAGQLEKLFTMVLWKLQKDKAVSLTEQDIKDFMAKSIETGMTKDGMTLPSPGFLYICGGPGTGKVCTSWPILFAFM